MAWVWEMVDRTQQGKAKKDTYSWMVGNIQRDWSGKKGGRIEKTNPREAKHLAGNGGIFQGPEVVADRAVPEQKVALAGVAATHKADCPVKHCKDCALSICFLLEVSY